MAESEGGGAATSLGNIPYVDLVLGAWRPREAAFQLAAALGVELGSVHGDDPGRALMGNGLRAVDVAARGDPIIMTAFDDAARIGAVLGPNSTVAVLAPRFDLPLRAEDEWFFLFLRRHVVSLALLGEEPPMTAVGRSLFDRRRGVVAPEAKANSLNPEQRRLLRFFLGLLPGPLAERLNIEPQSAGLREVGRDLLLIPDTYRDADPRLSSEDLDQMVDLELLDDGFRGFCQSFCTSFFAESAVLAIVCPAVGDAGTGLILVDDNLGVDVPKTRSEALSALRRNAKEFVFGNETIFLDDSLRPRFAADLHVALSPVVAKARRDGDCVAVDFRRHLPRAVLNGEDARLIEPLIDAPPVTLARYAEQTGHSVEEVEQSLRRLEQARIVRLDVVD